MPENLLVVIESEQGLLTSSGCMFEMLLNSPQCTVDPT